MHIAPCFIGIGPVCGLHEASLRPGFRLCEYDSFLAFGVGLSTSGLDRVHRKPAACGEGQWSTFIVVLWPFKRHVMVESCANDEERKETPLVPLTMS